MYRQRNSAALLPGFDYFRWEGKVELPGWQQVTDVVLRAAASVPSNRMAGCWPRPRVCRFYQRVGLV